MTLQGVSEEKKEEEGPEALGKLCQEKKERNTQLFFLGGRKKRERERKDRAVSLCFPREILLLTR